MLSGETRSELGKLEGSMTTSEAEADEGVEEVRIVEILLRILSWMSEGR